MKRRIIYLLVALVNTCLFSQNFSLDGKYNVNENAGIYRFDLKDDNFTYVFDRYFNPEFPQMETQKFSIQHIDGMPFIKLMEKIPEKITEFYQTNKRQDVLTDDKILFLACLVKNKNNPQIISMTAGFSKAYSLTKSTFSEQVRIYKDCSSFLIEKNKSYPVSNLDDLAVDTPWVENAPGYGIGEGFTIENTWGKLYTTLLIMNGYISYEKPYLYKQNGRVKKIKVQGLKSGKEKVLDVLDTPHPQTVDISFITEPEDIRITIEDAYPGTKYEDTCIHYMITYIDEVIPYENSIQ